MHARGYDYLERGASLLDIGFDAVSTSYHISPISSVYEYTV
jgi:hypothetical protein